MPDLRENLLGIVASVTQHPADEYSRMDLKTLSFEAFIDDIRECWAMFDAFRRVDIGFVPGGVLERARPTLNAAADLMANIRGFRIDQAGDPTQRRDTLGRSVRETTREAFSVVAPLLGYASVQGETAETLKAQATQQLDQLQLRVVELSKNAESMLQATAATSERILVTARRAAEQSAVVAHAAFFSNQAASHQDAATKWLKMTGVSAAALGLFVLILLASDPVSTSGDHGILVQVIFRRVLFGTAVSFLIVWSARNYRSHMHNLVVNTHRTVALRTFEALAKAVGDDPHARTAILHKTADAIFAHMPTGYMPAGADDVPSPTPWIEVLKAGEAATK